MPTEDLKLKVIADTAEAERQIEKLEKKGVSLKGIKLKLETSLAQSDLNKFQQGTVKAKLVKVKLDMADAERQIKELQSKIESTSTKKTSSKQLIPKTPLEYALLSPAEQKSVLKSKEFKREVDRAYYQAKLEDAKRNAREIANLEKQHSRALIENQKWISPQTPQGFGLLNDRQKAEIVKTDAFKRKVDKDFVDAQLINQRMIDDAHKKSEQSRIADAQRLAKVKKQYDDDEAKRTSQTEIARRIKANEEYVMRLQQNRVQSQTQRESTGQQETARVVNRGRSPIDKFLDDKKILALSPEQKQSHLFTEDSLKKQATYWQNIKNNSLATSKEYIQANAHLQRVNGTLQQVQQSSQQVSVKGVSSGTGNGLFNAGMIGSALSGLQAGIQIAGQVFHLIGRVAGAIKNLSVDIAGMVEEGSQMRIFEKNFEKLAGGADLAVEKMRLLRIASAGNLNTEELIQYGNMMSLMGFKVDDAVRFMDIIETKADEVSISFAVGQKAIQTYIATGRGMGLRQAGLSIPQVKGEEERLISATGKKKSELEAEELQTIRTNAILNVYGNTIENVTNKQLDAADKVQTLRTGYENLVISLKSLVAEVSEGAVDVFIGAKDVIGKVIDDFVAKSGGIEKVKEIFSRFATNVAKVMATMATTIVKGYATAVPLLMGWGRIFSNVGKILGNVVDAFNKFGFAAKSQLGDAGNASHKWGGIVNETSNASINQMGRFVNAIQRVIDKIEEATWRWKNFTSFDFENMKRSITMTPDQIKEQIENENSGAYTNPDRPTTTKDYVQKKEKDVKKEEVEKKEKSSTGSTRGGSTNALEDAFRKYLSEFESRLARARADVETFNLTVLQGYIDELESKKELIALSKDDATRRDNETTFLNAKRSLNQEIYETLMKSIPALDSMIEKQLESFNISREIEQRRKDEEMKLNEDRLEHFKRIEGRRMNMIKDRFDKEKALLIQQMQDEINAIPKEMSAEEKEKRRKEIVVSFQPMFAEINKERMMAGFSALYSGITGLAQTFHVDMDGVFGKIVTHTERVLSIFKDVVSVIEGLQSIGKVASFFGTLLGVITAPLTGGASMAGMAGSGGMPSAGGGGNSYDNVAQNKMARIQTASAPPVVNVYIKSNLEAQKFFKDHYPTYDKEKRELIA